MNIKEEYIIQAIDEFEQVQEKLSKLQGKNFNVVHKEINNEFYGNTQNYDGELFDFCLSRILGTINKGKNKTAFLDKNFMFDISDDFSGEWIDTSIFDLYRLLKYSYCKITGLKNELTDKELLEYMRNAIKEA